MVSFKAVFKTFIKSILQEMKAESKPEWKKLCLVGAENVARKLQREGKLDVKPQVLEGESPQDPIIVSHEQERHEFWVETSKFHYVRGFGKPKHLFKEFAELRKEFWQQQQEIEKNIGKNKETQLAMEAKTQLRISDDLDEKDMYARAEEALAEGQWKYKGAVKTKKKEKKALRILMRKQPKKPPPVPETPTETSETPPVPETPTETSETPPETPPE